MSSSRSVMLLVTSSSVAGAQRQVHDLAIALQEREWRVSVVSLLPLDFTPGDEMFAGLPGRGIATYSLGMGRGIPDPRAIVRLGSLVSELRIDVLHAHMVHAIILARVTRMTRTVPALVSTMHNQHQGSRWRYWAYRLTDRLSDLTTTVSHLACEDAVRSGAVPRDRVVVVPNGIDAGCFDSDTATRAGARAALEVGEEFVWLAAGRLDDAKDYPTMLEAVSLAHGGRPFRLFVAGVGPLKPALEARIDSLGLGDRVSLLGLRSDVPALMAAADGFVMSSAWEGLPMVLLEAGASGLPIVATDVGGSRDAIVAGVSGLIVPPGNAQALADAMSRVMALPDDERAAMGSAGRTHVTRTFDLDVVADRWSGLYEELLARRGAGV